MSEQQATPSSTKRRRRSGKDLERAILNAGWDELIRVGYANLTMDSVARRAGTSEPVLYRRWQNKDALVLDALKNYRAAHPVQLPDTGSLRTDLLAALTGMGVTRVDFFAVVAGVTFGGLGVRMGLSPKQVRDHVFGDQREANISLLYKRAEQRGEIDLRAINPVVLSVPFDLIRHDLMMNPAPVSQDRIIDIVDTVFLPLVEKNPGSVHPT